MSGRALPSPKMAAAGRGRERPGEATSGGRARLRYGGAQRALGGGRAAALGPGRAGPGHGQRAGPRRAPGPRRGGALGNPGSFDELHRQCKEVFPQQMEGVKLIVNKALSSHFQVTHTVHMSTLGASNYHFNATFVGDRQLGPTEAFPTLVGDMDNGGSLNAQVLHLVAERLRTKAVFQTQQAKFLTWQFDGEYRGDDCTATLTLGNPDLLGESERHPPPGAGRRDGLPPAAGRGGGHPHAGGQIHRPELGGDAQRGLRRRPRQLLPQSQRAGAGRGGAGGQHAAAGHHLRLRLPAQPAASQRRLQRAPGQQLERGGGAGEEAAPAARHPGSGRLPQPLEESLPLRLQRHRGLRGAARPPPALLREPPCRRGGRPEDPPPGDGDRVCGVPPRRGQPLG
ncbi:mitochondrial import receptor subunit TOM40B isoform X1 [Anas acuta]|uniref:mitochondrial import receptor subunit TOM40B isoform X1 n=1 Tax=Anas acuta TaxID=28680 RepID=UPI0035C8D7F4